MGRTVEQLRKDPLLASLPKFSSVDFSLVRDSGGEWWHSRLDQDLLVTRLRSFLHWLDQRKEANIILVGHCMVFMCLLHTFRKVPNCVLLKCRYFGGANRCKEPKLRPDCSFGMHLLKGCEYWSHWFTLIRKPRKKRGNQVRPLHRHGPTTTEKTTMSADEYCAFLDGSVSDGDYQGAFDRDIKRMGLLFHGGVESSSLTAIDALPAMFDGHPHRLHIMLSCTQIPGSLLYQQAMEKCPGMHVIHSQLEKHSLRLLLSSNGLKYRVKFHIVDPATMKPVKVLDSILTLDWNPSVLTAVSFHHTVLPSHSEAYRVVNYSAK
jgi:hypothetical protein